MMGWNDNGGWGAGQWLTMGLMMVLFGGVVIALVAGLLRNARSARGVGAASRNPTQTALGVLEQRFARGEIDEEEFIQRRSALLPISTRWRCDLRNGRAPTNLKHRRAVERNAPSLCTIDAFDEAAQP